MGQWGGVVAITREERDEAARAGQEPGACPVRSKHLAFDAAAARMGEPFGGGEIIPSCGGGPGFTEPCDRPDCEWARVPSPDDSPGQVGYGGTPCARWVRLATFASAAKPW